MNRANENGKEVWNLYAAKVNGNYFTSRVLIKMDLQSMINQLLIS